MTHPSTVPMPDLPILRSTRSSTPRGSSIQTGFRPIGFLQDRIASLLKHPVGRPPLHVRCYYANVRYQAASWNTPRRVDYHGRVASRRALSPRRLQRHQPVETACEHCHLLQQAQHLRAVDQARQGCYPLDAAVMPVVLSQRGTASASRSRPQVGNVLRTLATPPPIKDWSLTSLKEKPVKIGAKRVSHGRHVTFQLPKSQFRSNSSPTSRLIADLRPSPEPEAA